MLEDSAKTILKDHIEDKIDGIFNEFGDLSDPNTANVLLQTVTQLDTILTGVRNEVIEALIVEKSTDESNAELKEALEKTLTRLGKFRSRS